MNELCLIKSYAHGITLMLNPDAKFEDILEDVKTKFVESRNFFKDSNMALSLQGRVLTDEEEIKLVEVIQTSSKLRIFCIVDHNETPDKNFVKALEYTNENLFPKDGGQFYKGSLCNGAEIETENSIVILGDVNAGCSVTSAKNIIIIGGLYGEAYAGASGNNNSYVVALEMEPTKLKIGDFRYKSSKSNKWGIRKKIQPKVAYIKNKKIVFDELTKDLLDSFA